MANTAKRGRRSAWATVALLGVALLLSGGAYFAFSNTASADSQQASSQTKVDEGQKLYLANCATCHGMNAEGTAAGVTLIGVGAASVDFQLGTGRMPMQMDGPQAYRKSPQFKQPAIDSIAAYIASLAPGPGVPADTYLDASKGDPARGAELYRVNCAMCHNVAYQGGALTEGKFAPPLIGVESRHIYEAMLTGPQNMPVFNDNNLGPEDKRDIISAIRWTEANGATSVVSLGGIGPVAEGIFLWLIGLGGIVGVTVWLTSRPN
ncbi:MAG: cytochrome c [Microbacteriaceae bacterium]